MLAEVFELSGQICFRIPKRKGDGFLKSCIGYHGLNKQGIKLSELLEHKDYIDVGKGEFCDLDGYLAISIRREFYDYTKKRDKIKEELKTIIKEVFPFVSGFVD